MTIKLETVQIVITNVPKKKVFEIIDVFATISIQENFNKKFQFVWEQSHPRVDCLLSHLQQDYILESCIVTCGKFYKHLDNVSIADIRSLINSRRKHNYRFSVSLPSSDAILLSLINLGYHYGFHSFTVEHLPTYALVSFVSPNEVDLTWLTSKLGVQIKQPTT